MSQSLISPSLTGMSFYADWANSSPAENLARASLIVALFVLSPVVAMLVERGYLALMKYIGAYRWMSMADILAKWDHYQKVKNNSKIFLDDRSLCGDEHHLETLRNGHFFSERYDKLIKDASEHQRCGLAAGVPEGDASITISPPSLMVYSADSKITTSQLGDMVAREYKKHWTTGEDRVRTPRPGEYAGFGSQPPQQEGDARRRYNRSGTGPTFRPDDGYFGGPEEYRSTEEIEIEKTTAMTEYNHWTRGELKVAEKMESELRPFRKFVTGNFHPLFADVVFVFIVVGGWLFAFFLLGIDFFSFLNGGTFLLGVTLFKLADALKNWIARWGIFYSDLVERGDLVTIPGSFNSPMEKVGCVLEVTPACTKILTTDNNCSLFDDGVRMDWVVNGTPGVGNGVLRKESDSSFFGIEGRSTSTNSKSFSDLDDREAVIYVQKHVRAILTVVLIPNCYFTDYISGKPIMWRRIMHCKPMPAPRSETGEKAR